MSATNQGEPSRLPENRHERPELNTTKSWNFSLAEPLFPTGYAQTYFTSVRKRKQPLLSNFPSTAADLTVLLADDNPVQYRHLTALLHLKTGQSRSVVHPEFRRNPRNLVAPNVLRSRRQQRRTALEELYVTVLILGYLPLTRHASHVTDQATQ